MKNFNITYKKVCNKTKIILLLIFILALSTFAERRVIGTIDCSYGATKNGCWADVTYMVLSYYGKNLTKNDIVNAGNAGGTGAPLCEGHDGKKSIKELLLYFNITSEIYCNSSLQMDFASIKRNIKAGKPIVAAWMHDDQRKIMQY